MYRGFAKLRVSSAALESIHRDLALPDEPAATGDAILAPRKDIRLRGIRYAYPSAPDKPVFDGFDLVVPANASVGIAGRSGAGKSTLMDLLLGLLQPQAGTLEIDGVAVDAGNVAAWQRAIGYVPQHIFLCDGSIVENVAFGVAPKKVDLERVREACRRAELHSFISSLPGGYETIVGERGVRLSGGQRQRVGLARALYKRASVLILDEATSALDDATEASVIDAVHRLGADYTVLMIAHRVTTLQRCDMIYRLEQGRVAKQGTFAEVLGVAQLPNVLRRRPEHEYRG